MHASAIVSGDIIAIEFLNDMYPFEVWDLEGLCDVAGCNCQGRTFQCNNIGALFYNGVIAAHYATMCLKTCRCEVLERRTTINEARLMDHRGNSVLRLPSESNNVANRRYPDKAIVEGGDCLAGEPSGWTFQRSAADTCCKDYAFKAIAPQEARMIYGLPLIEDMITGAVTIGVCLKSDAR